MTQYGKYKILKKYDVSYFNCKKCGFCQTENPFWLEEAYKEPINQSDTGILQRNNYFSKITLCIIYFLIDKGRGKYLDYAGGYGIFTRLMRDFGLDYYWNDPYTPNIFAKGFEKKKDDNKFNSVTFFETIEHFTDPEIEIKKLLNYSDTLIFSTTLITSPPPKPGDWWYYGHEHGQHVSFWTYDSLNRLAEKFNMYFYSDKKQYHVISAKKISKFKMFMIFTITRFGLFQYVSRKLKTKTFSDSNMLN